MDNRRREKLMETRIIKTENPMEKKKRKMEKIQSQNRRRKIVLFFGVIYIFAVIGLLIPLRPKVSEMEKRTLAEFPKFTVGSFLSGEYFSKIDTWYSDTFPFREKLISGNRVITAFQGIKTVEVTGEMASADEIPDAPFQAQESDSKDTVPAESEGTVEENTQGDSGKETGEESEQSTEEQTAQEETAKEDGQEGTAQEADETAASDESGAINENGQGVGEESQSLGALMIMGNAAYEYYGFNQEKAGNYITAINRLAESLPENVAYYQMVVPTSMGVVLAKSVLEGIATSDQEQALDYFYKSFSDRVHAINVYPVLREHNGEYIYFRTDHHWTALGAYYAYQEFCKSAGLNAADIGSFETMEFPGFLGTFYADCGNPVLAENPDTITAYLPKGTNEITLTQQDGTELHWRIVNDVSQYRQGQKYSAFIGGDNPYSIIENPAVADDSSILIIKESYGNAFVPFLVDHYHTVHIVDYRYYTGNLQQLVADRGIQNVLMLNYIDTTSAENNISKLLALTGGN